MAGAMTVDGRIVRIDRPMPWVGRLLSLPLLAASFYLLWNVALGLRQDFSGFGRLADDLCRWWCSRDSGCSWASPESSCSPFAPSSC
ncbi:MULTISPECIES: hypothetical protein [unclassified Bradyrhizobium]|uniref:hypothetical protein n=1 Tax=unclassified Bradyrhizobium TaxID=2631580 RepID=UPI001FFA8605|nr:MULTISPECIES: hypothetical protein [unclassified Bradyrhizobium]